LYRCRFNRDNNSRRPALTCTTPTHSILAY
jgi:hypothetical protein